jgi:transposase-like protein
MAGFVSLDGLFAGRHFDREIIILCVRWYSVLCINRHHWSV